jgi:hypothetical protein
LIRPNYAFAEPQIERLRELSQVMDLPASELARRALDEWLERIWPRYEKEVVERRRLLALHKEQMAKYERGELTTINHDELMAKLEAQRTHVEN